MKWLLMLVCGILIGCGTIYALVHATVPNLISPEMFPKAQAREAKPALVEGSIAAAGSAVRDGVADK